MRTRTPFIEAFKKKQRERDADAGVQPTSDAAAPAIVRDLKPKTMSDSYHQVVSGCHMTLLGPD
jgi:hypothetical protein